MNKSLILITENFSFKNLSEKTVSPINLYKEQMKKWLFLPIKYLADMHKNHKEIRFSHGYSVFALELLFFEPHGQYLEGKLSGESRTTFYKGFNRFIGFLLKNKYLDLETKNKIDSMKFYNITRCGIFHSLTIKSKVLLDSRKNISDKVFANSIIDNGLLVYPWNFVIALEKYFNEYIKELEKPETNVLKENFQKTFDLLFPMPVPNSSNCCTTLLKNKNNNN
jgi:hypothetical protein